MPGRGRAHASQQRDRDGPGLSTKRGTLTQRGDGGHLQNIGWNRPGRGLAKGFFFIFGGFFVLFCFVFLCYKKLFKLYDLQTPTLEIFFSFRNLLFLSKSAFPFEICFSFRNLLSLYETCFLFMKSAFPRAPRRAAPHALRGRPCPASGATAVPPAGPCRPPPPKACQTKPSHQFIRILSKRLA